MGVGTHQECSLDTLDIAAGPQLLYVLYCACGMHHSIALHLCIALHSTALRACTDVLCLLVCLLVFRQERISTIRTALHGTSLRCTALHRTALLLCAVQAGDERFKAELGWVVDLDMWDATKQLAAHQLKAFSSQLASVTSQEQLRESDLTRLDTQVGLALLTVQPGRRCWGGWVRGEGGGGLEGDAWRGRTAGVKPHRRFISSCDEWRWTDGAYHTSQTWRMMWRMFAWYPAVSILLLFPHESLPHLAASPMTQARCFLSTTT